MAKRKAKPKNSVPKKMTGIKCGCGEGRICTCRSILAIAIIAVLWIWPSASWSRWVVTILAALILLGSLTGGWCRKK